MESNYTQHAYGITPWNVMLTGMYKFGVKLISPILSNAHLSHNIHVLDIYLIKCQFYPIQHIKFSYAHRPGFSTHIHVT